MLDAIINFFKRLFGTKTETTYCNTNDTNNTSKSTEQPKTQKPKKDYQPKKLLTNTELRFFKAIEQAVPNDYITLPQINLASIIKRTDEHKYQNELYRNIDFVIFDNTYNPLLLIEINDKTHKEKARIARDIKVKEICQNAGLPLITFWTDYGINQEYIDKRIAEYIA